MSRVSKVEATSPSNTGGVDGLAASSRPGRRVPLLNTISRAGSVLALFTGQRPEWGVREAATELGMPRSNTHVVMSSLADIGLLARTPDLRYRLGWRLLTLSGRLLDSTEVARVGAPVAAQLAGQLRHTVSIAAYDNGQLVTISQAGPGGPVPAAGLGQRLPAHSSACGKIMLAHLGVDPGTLRLPRLTRNTMTDPERLRAALAVVRRNDLAFDRQETHDALACVASSIRDGRTGAVIAALSLCLPPEDLDREITLYARGVLRAARQVSALLNPDPGPRGAL